jgi:hypothetical protein
MAQLTEDARWLGFSGEKILLRVDYVSGSSLGHAKPGIELLIYHADRYNHVFQTYGVYMSNIEAVDFMARLDKALMEYDRQAASNGE